MGGTLSSSNISLLEVPQIGEGFKSPTDINLSFFEILRKELILQI